MTAMLKQKLTPERATVRRWVNLVIVVAIILVAFFIRRHYLQSFTVYDFSHLTPLINMGEMSEFVPLPGNSVPGMVRAAENEILALYVNRGNATTAVYDKRNGHIWYSSPLSHSTDPIANPFERNVMNSHLGMTFYAQRGRVMSRWSFNDAADNGQFELFNLPNGLAIRYTMGNLELGIYALPRYIEAERFQTRVLDQIEGSSDRSWISRNFQPSQEREGFMRMSDGIRVGGANIERALRIFDEIGYTPEELLYDNAQAGYESEMTTELFIVYIEFVLDGADLVTNVPISRIEIPEFASLRSLEVMRFFGAGGPDDEGFLLVPSGSGALIEFNNGRYREERFSAPVYGIDLLTTHRIPTILQAVRLPVIGINKGNAAMLAHIENGAALATVNADVAGRTNSFNYAWFSFTIRRSQIIEIGLSGGVPLNSMNVIQPAPYEGDITIRYHFVASDTAEVTLGDMVQVYQQHLVNTGVLTPLTGNMDRTFYLDIIGAADVQTHTLGTPHMTLEIMTSFDEANHILDILNAGGVDTVQMILHGWFNRGINHDVAKNVNPIRGLGSQREMQELHERLQTNGGALAPAVNFAFTNFDSRRFNRTFEASRNISGRIATMTNVSRDMLTTRFGSYWNDWFFLVNPAVLPLHVDSFIPAYHRNAGLNSLALTDFGDILTESLYRRNPVDREHSRLISAEQIGRLGNEFPNLVIFGGNDYSLRYAAHLVDIPVRTDWFYIIDHEVPFYQMVMHGFIEFAGAPINLQPIPDTRGALLNSMATGASPRFTMTAHPTRLLQFSPYERMYSTHYVNWINTAIEHYRIFNDVYRDLRTERITDFFVLHGTVGNSVTVTVFSNGTRIYVNNTAGQFEVNGLVVPPLNFVVVP